MTDQAFKSAVRAAASALGGRQKQIEWQIATLGDGHGNVMSSNNMVFCRLSVNSSVIEVLNLKCAPIDNLRVRIAKTPEMPLVWQVIGQADQREDENGAGTNQGANYSIPLHSRLHDYLGVDQANIDWRQITDLRVYATTGFTVGILSGIIPRGGIDVVVPTQTLDLTSHVPGSGAILCLISIDQSGLLVATDGPAEVDEISLTPADIPATPTGNFRLAAVRLYADQAAISETTITNDIIDLRWPQEVIAGGGGSGVIWGNVIIVAKSGGDFTTIQGAINAAVSGDTVIVMPGVYAENVTLRDGVSVISWEQGASIQPASGMPVTIPAVVGSYILDSIGVFAPTGESAIGAASGSAYLTVFLDGCHVIGATGNYAIDLSANPMADLSLTRTRANGILVHGSVPSGSSGTGSYWHRFIDADLVGDLTFQAEAGCLVEFISGGIGGDLSVGAGVTLGLSGLPRISGAVSGSGTLNGDYLNGNGQLVTEATSGSPFVVNSSVVNTNLNADLLDGSHAAAFALTTHDIITSHTYTGGAALDVFGLSAPNTIARLTPSADVSAGVAAILRSTAAGGLTLKTLTVYDPIAFNGAGTLTKTGAGALAFSAAGAYILTVPATGTAALLGAANIFTTTQQITVPTTTTTGLILKTSDDGVVKNLLEIENSAAGVIAKITSGGLVYLQNGSVSAPAFSFVNATATGMSYDAVNSQLVFSYGAARIITGNNGGGTGGRLGINLDNPLACLDVGGSIWLRSGGGSLIGEGHDYGTPANAASGYLKLYDPSTGNTTLMGTGNYSLYLGINNATVITLRGGNVGVGTILTGVGVTYQKLSVNGSALFTGDDSTQESPMMQIVPSYVVNTHASYTTRTVLSQWAAAGAQEVLRMESGAAAMIGFLGASAVAQQANTVALDTLLVNYGLRASGGYANFATTIQPRAGTTAANTAPLKFTTQASGLTVIEQGAMELIGNSLQFSQLARRRGVVMSQNTRTADFTLAASSGTSESAAVVTSSHGAGYLEVGKSEEIILVGTMSQRSNPNANITIRVKYAGSTILTFATAINNAIAANSAILIRVYCTCRTTGATGTMQINSVIEINGTATDPQAASLATIDTTTAQDTTVTFQWGSDTDAANTITIHQGRVLCVEPNK